MLFLFVFEKGFDKKKKIAALPTPSPKTNKKNKKKERYAGSIGENNYL